MNFGLGSNNCLLLWLGPPSSPEITASEISVRRILRDNVRLPRQQAWPYLLPVFVFGVQETGVRGGNKELYPCSQDQFLLTCVGRA